MCVCMRARVGVCRCVWMAGESYSCDDVMAMLNFDTKGYGHSLSRSLSHWLARSLARSLTHACDANAVHVHEIVISMRGPSRVCTHTCTHARTHACMHARTHACMHTRMHTYWGLLTCADI